MVTQRRYSVTGQTPPDDAEALKAGSPKVQALDTSTTCGLCEASAEASSSPEPVVRGRQMSKANPIVRTSSKRSATQLPNSPSHELPPKIARYGLLQDAMDVDTDVDTDATTSSCTSADSDWDATDQATSHSLSPSSLPPDPDDYCMEHLALSPPHSRQHSLDCTEHACSWLPADAAASSIGYAAPTFLTLPPEIRHQIYRHCDELVFAQPLLYCIATAFDKIQHPLASVSRQVRSEALAIFYSYNTWTIKVEFKIMYDSFQHWIIRLGDGAGFLRLVDLSVRGTLFKPKRAHAQSVLLHGQLIQITAGVASSGREELYSPPDGDASFRIDLSEKHFGGKVQLLRNDGTKEAGNMAVCYLESMVRILWDKRRSNNLNGQDWVSMVDQFLHYVGGWP